MPADPVTLAYVHPHEVAYSWHMSMMEAFGHDLSHRQRLVRGGTIAVKYGTGGIIQARNSAVEKFLTSDVPWLFWIDTDMGFAPDTVDRLVDQADPDERPIVGALAFSQREVEQDGYGGYQVQAMPTLYDWHTNPDGLAGFAARHHYQRDTLQPVSGTGSACIVIHRSVFEKIADKNGPCWYDPLRNPTDGRWLGEDLSFCVRAIEAGLTIWVDTAVKTTHFKHVWVGEQE